MPRPGLPLLLWAATAVALGACATPAESPDRSPSPRPTSGADTTLSPADVPEALRGLGVTTVHVGDRALTVAVADTSEARRHGLMGVEDLGPLDGLLFVYADSVEAAFHMRDVPIPLDIAFFDPQRRLLEVVRMVPCTAEPCRAYPAPAPIAWALEAEAGDLAGLRVGDVLRVGP